MVHVDQYESCVQDYFNGTELSHVSKIMSRGLGCLRSIQHESRVQDYFKFNGTELSHMSKIMSKRTGLSQDY